MDSPCSVKACVLFLSVNILKRLDKFNLQTFRNIEKLCKKSVKLKTDIAFLQDSSAFYDFKKIITCDNYHRNHISIIFLMNQNT